MMKQEFIQAWIGAGGTAEVRNIGRDTWSAVQALYLSDDLDSIACGVDRHLKFATWCIANQARIREEAQVLLLARSEAYSALQTKMVSLRLQMSLL